MKKTTFKNTVHGILGESYMVYVVCLVAGVFMHSLFDIDLISQNLQYFGVFCMVFSPLLISSAQRASRRFKQVHAEREVGPSDFMHGPYKYLQSPTHMGIFLLSIGFSIVMNSAMLVVATFVAYLITHLIFLPKEQEVLKRKYGATYEAYLKKVKLSI
ncbi:MAG: hypothetical protein KBB86_00910 [Candidatus Pacebacteria bacterium]|nr:hypothetical protein [Candidatus Paceibacterota bacterium]